MCPDLAQLDCRYGGGFVAGFVGSKAEAGTRHVHVLHTMFVDVPRV